MILSIYAPNGPKEKFFVSLREKLQALNYEQTIILGNFTGVIDTKLDRLHPSSKRVIGKIPKVGLELMGQENLVDIWRFWNKNKKEFTFPRHTRNPVPELT